MFISTRFQSPCTKWLYPGEMVQSSEMEQGLGPMVPTKSIHGRALKYLLCTHLQNVRLGTLENFQAKPTSLKIKNLRLWGVNCLPKFAKLINCRARISLNSPVHHLFLALVLTYILSAYNMSGPWSGTGNKTVLPTRQDLHLPRMYKHRRERSHK